MRLNKKLAALTMSVVMVASNTAPVTVFASGIQTEVQEAGIVGATEWTLAGEPEFIGDDATKTVKVKYTLTNNETGEPKEFEEEAAIIKTTPATYQNGTMVDAKVTIQGQDYVGTIEFNDKLTSKNWKKDISVVTKAATCEETGLKNIVDYLLVPGAELNADNTANEADIIEMNIKEQDVEIPALGHDFGEAVIQRSAQRSAPSAEKKRRLRRQRPSRQMSLIRRQPRLLLLRTLHMSLSRTAMRKWRWQLMILMQIRFRAMRASSS